jgi:serine/threonine-protein kinase
MGEVYRARDSKLGRDVALKVLPERFAADADRLSRFQREAQLLASLNHPHIGAIYGLEDGPPEGGPYEEGGPYKEGVGAGFSRPVLALVLELVEGPTLADRIADGPLPIDEALAIARQIAEALEAAHEKGVIHRDLKPANIKLTPGGQVKVLDFGLAKLVERETAASSPSMSMSPTLGVEATFTGMILGSAGYMSPEQARGKVVDKRTDVWSFGCVLFEMLAGRRCFEVGDSVSDAVAAVLKNEPDWQALPAATPAAVRRLLRRCLKKDPADRLHDIADARLEIDEAWHEPAVVALVAPPARSRERVILLAALAAVTLAAVWLAVRALVPAPAAMETRLEIYAQPFPGPGGRVQVSTSGGAQVQWSANGRELFYIALDSRMMAVPITFSPAADAIVPGAPVPLFMTHIGSAVANNVRQQYDVAADGRFLMNNVIEDAPTPITVLLNWKGRKK